MFSKNIKNHHKLQRINSTITKALSIKIMITDPKTFKMGAFHE